jgi:hypothetical protein
MYAQWQDALATEEELKLAREKRRERRRVRKERRLQRELQKEVIRGKHQMAEKDPLRRRVSTNKGKDANVFLQQRELEVQPVKKGLSRKLKVAMEDKDHYPSTDCHSPLRGDSSLSETTMLSRPKVPSRTNSAKRMLLSGMSRSQHDSPMRAPQFSGAKMPTMAPATTTTPTNLMGAANDGRSPPNTPPIGNGVGGRKNRFFLTRLGIRRPMSSDRLVELGGNSTPEILRDDAGPPMPAFPLSPSMPLMALPDDDDDEQQLLELKASPHERLSNTNLESVAIDMPPYDQLDLSNGENKHEEDDESDQGIIV